MVGRHGRGPGGRLLSDRCVDAGEIVPNFHEIKIEPYVPAGEYDLNAILTLVSDNGTVAATADGMIQTGQSRLAFRAPEQNGAYRLCLRRSSVLDTSGQPSDDQMIVGEFTVL